MATVTLVTDFTRTDVAHLLRRAGFFSSADEVDALAAEASWADVVDKVLDASANPPESTPPEVAPLGTTTRDAIVAASRYWYDRMATTPTPIVEKVAFFWHGILTSSVPNPSMGPVFKQIQTWRRLGLGDIHELMQAMAIDPAMLDYLDNADNVKAAPNENFARELMELFTMGNGTFTEADVIAMARAWTGHNLQYATETYVVPGGPARHRAEDALRHHQELGRPGCHHRDRARVQAAGVRPLPGRPDLVGLRLPRTRARRLLDELARGAHRRQTWT